ncbi:M23 family peptidase [Cellulomonas sp. WB94]|uniref:M23 family metallopeptidase n=1 Tax=Cellulomonas sp. WB94 TaxID=2173174 RepID=UPI000D57D8D2|nr:M23 family metallopeptidase [Cellulomonas sp. WB94]PVU81862.1 M23 family peptidase [Cellulomonas sp. WB94]
MTPTFAAVGAAAAALALAASTVTCGGPPPTGLSAGVDRATVTARPAVAATAHPMTPTYAPPVDVPVTVVRAFEPPPAPWAAGHRGVDLAASDGAPVLAPGDGIVTFAGPVAGRPVVVVSHPDGLRSSLEPVVGSVPVGTSVTRGQVVGTLADVVTHCAPRQCVHWGVRDGETYLDPMSLLPIHGPVVLLPLDE